MKFDLSQIGNRIERECTRQPATFAMLCRCAFLIFSATNVAVWLLPLMLSGQEFVVPIPSATANVSLSSDTITAWHQGETEYVHLVGSVDIQQGNLRATADEAIVWIQSAGDAEPVKKLVVYLEGQQVVVRSTRDGKPHADTGHSEDTLVDQVWMGRLYSENEILVNTAPSTMNGELPGIFHRAVEFHAGRMDNMVKQVSFVQTESETQTLIDPVTGRTRQVIQEPSPVVPDLSVPDVRPEVPTPIAQQDGAPDFAQDFTPDLPASPPGSAGAQVSIVGRDPTILPNFRSIKNPDNPNELIWLGTGGVRVAISSPDLNQIDAFRADSEKQVVILADNVVAWQSRLPDGSQRWEMYLDGNVVFAKDRRIIYAEQMYYDANYQRGTILNADVYTPIQNFEGLVRLKAAVVQQADANNMTAYGAAFTSSRLAFPRYWLQSESIDINRVQNVKTDPVTGAVVTNNSTQLPATEDEYFATSNRNRIYAAGVPVFGWPRFRTSLEDPSLYIKRLRVGNDSVFGFQLLTTWDLNQLFGLGRNLEGTELLGSVDYLSDRGLAFGSEAKYKRKSFFGIAGDVQGVYKSWFVNDDGLDNLGRGRTALTPEEELRGRVLWRHYHRLSSGYNLRAELGYISDRNFLESFYEREWDTEKDATTGFWLERNFGTQSYNLTGNVHVNDFFTQTAWLPRFDQFTIGQPLFSRQSIVRHGHSHIGYGRVRVADAPLDPAEQFDPLAWEADVDGIRAGTRQQLDFPRQFGAVKVVPYVLGDLSYWQEDLNGNDALRAYGQAGIRASLPFWKVDPSVQSTLWNVNGLAHKVTFELDAFYADSSQDLSRFALYDNLDDDSQEAFRRRFEFNTFGVLPGGNVPLKYDERYFALRNGFQSDVTASSAEIADDLSVVRIGVRQRWQTKRGLPGSERIIDWISFDAATTLFPKADRDNFGSDFGVFNYDFKWFIGDRVSLVSDGYADFFGQGLRTASFGLQTNRPGVSDAYIGIRSIEGPISSNVLSTAVTYRMSEKWGLRANSQIDFGETGTIGNALSLIYIGESFLWQFGINADFSRSNVGFRFGFEPRFINRPRLFRPGGQALPPASAAWLE